jgi:hypothetical protein
MTWWTRWYSTSHCLAERDAEILIARGLHQKGRLTIAMTSRRLVTDRDDAPPHSVGAVVGGDLCRDGAGKPFMAADEDEL